MYLNEFQRAMDFIILAAASNDLNDFVPFESIVKWKRSLSMHRGSSMLIFVPIVLTLVGSSAIFS